MKMELFYDRFDKECMNVPIFKYSDPYQVFQRLSCASNEDIVIIKEKLQTRANENKEIIVPEITNMYKLKQIIDDYISDKQTTIKTVVLEDFSNTIDYVISTTKRSGRNVI